MELLCCIALFIVSLVTATPYGYSTKGGAVAKADASAASGAFSEPAPLLPSIPTGNGFSGSYSKSSSSSFASSSASSSSSSSSFSFGGTGGGLNTFKTHNDGATGGVGCSSGSCQSSGGHNIAGSTGSGGYGNYLKDYTGHNAAGATSGSFATGGAFIGGNLGSLVPCSGNGCQNQATGCEGATCNNIEVNNKCASGKCSQETEASLNNKCTSGNCEPDLPGIPLSGYNSNTGCDSGDCATYNSNDIPAKVAANADINLTHDAKHQTKNNEQVSIGYNVNGCSHGKCGSPTSSNIIPTTELSISDLYQNPSTQQPSHGPICNTPDCISGNENLAVGHNGFLGGLNKPASDLSSPDIGTSCTTSNCKNDYSVTGTKNTPSSNNLHVTKPIEKPVNSQCSSGNCGSPGVPRASGPGSTLDCAFGNCDVLLLNQASPDSTYPSKIFSNVSPNTGCNTPNCAPGVVTSGNNFDINQGLVFTDSGSTHLDKLPSFTAPGVPAYNHPTFTPGCNTPNCFPQPSSNPPSYISPHQVSPNVGCNTPNCASGLPTFNANLNNQGQSGFIFTANNPPVSPNKIPGYTSGHTPTTLGTTSGCTTPNCTPKPASDLPSYNKLNFGTPLNCNTPNCYNNQLHPIGDTQVKIPIQTDGYAPTGSVPNHVITGPSLPNVSNGIHQSDCQTENCAGNISPTDSFKEKLPPYTGGFGGPIGILKPNELSPPSVVFPSLASTLVHPDKNLPAYTGGFGGPAGLLQPIGTVSAAATTTLPMHPSAIGSVGSQNNIFGHYEPTTGTPSSGGVSLDSGFYTNLNPTHPSQPLHGKFPSHVGGFEAPTGLLKPNEFGTGHTSTNYKNTANSGATAQDSQTLLQLGTNTANFPDTSKIADKGTNQAFGQFDVSKPIQTDAGTVKPTSQKVQDDQKFPPYTGGFHAPAGLLKPNDYILSSSGHLNKLTISTLNQPCSSENCGAQTNPSGHTLGQTDTSKNTQVETLAGSQADAVAYTGGFRGPPGFLKPYDDRKSEGFILGGKLSLSSDSKSSTVLKTGSKDNQDHYKVTSGDLGTISGQIAAGGVHFVDTNQANVGAQAGAVASVVSSGTGHDKFSGQQAGSGKDIKLIGGCGKGCGSSDALEASYNAASAAAQASAVSQASASAGAFSGGYSGIGIQNNQAGSGTDIKTSGGCDGGCGSTSYTGSSNLGYNAADYSTGLSAANAKSVAGARAFGGFGGSYASSSASSHASSGFPTKGGYGK